MNKNWYSITQHKVYKLKKITGDKKVVIHQRSVTVKFVSGAVETRDVLIPNRTDHCG